MRFFLYFVFFFFSFSEVIGVEFRLKQLNFTYIIHLCCDCQLNVGIQLLAESKKTKLSTDCRVFIKIWINLTQPCILPIGCDPLVESSYLQIQSEALQKQINNLKGHGRGRFSKGSLLTLTLLPLCSPVSHLLQCLLLEPFMMINLRSLFSLQELLSTYCCSELKTQESLRLKLSFSILGSFWTGDRVSLDFDLIIFCLRVMSTVMSHGTLQ